MQPASARSSSEAESAPQRSSAKVAAGATLTVDLGAVRQNYRRLRARLGGRACSAVVKADGYGLGAAEVAKALIKEGCDTFFVAHLAEGISLREALGAVPTISVLHGLPPGTEPECADAELMPVLNSADQVEAWKALARKLERKLPAAIQFDTGMSRLGLSERELNAIAADPDALDGVDVQLVMSHLACADEPEHPANLSQLRAFERLRVLLPAAPLSLANSSGIFLGSGYHHDLVRPGAALYGINPTPALPNPMRPVVSLFAPVVQVRQVPAGAGIGYAHRAVAERPMTLAPISLGYADGWRRSAVAGAFHRGIRLPFVGRVSMDLIILDASALPSGALREGDMVELIGEHQSVDEIAHLAGTIGYEIIASLGKRVRRLYVDAAGA